MSCTACGAHIKNSAGHEPKGLAWEVFKSSLQASFVVALLVLTSPCRFLMLGERDWLWGAVQTHRQALHQQKQYDYTDQFTPNLGYTTNLCRNVMAMGPGNSAANGKQEGDQNGELGQQSWGSCFFIPPLPDWPVHCAAKRISMTISLWAMESCSHLPVLPEDLTGSQRSWRLASVGIILHFFSFPTVLPDCQRRLPGRCPADQ